MKKLVSTFKSIAIITVLGSYFCLTLWALVNLLTPYLLPVPPPVDAVSMNLHLGLFFFGLFGSYVSALVAEQDHAQQLQSEWQCAVELSEIQRIAMQQRQQRESADEHDEALYTQPSSPDSTTATVCLPAPDLRGSYYLFVADPYKPIYRNAPFAEQIYNQFDRLSDAAIDSCKNYSIYGNE